MKTRPLLNSTEGQTPPPATPAAREMPKKWRRVISRIARFFLLVIVGFAAGVAGLVVCGYIYFTHDLPSIEKLKDYSPPIVTQFYADNGELIGEFCKERRFVVPLDQIPQTLKDAFITAEDKNFLQHSEMDWWAILKAFTPKIHYYIKIGCCSSTITRQTARMFLPSSERTFRRKVKETILWIRVERSLGKEHILFLYLNQVYLGSSAFGIEAAARTYFDKSVKDLTIAECAMLAGLPKGPTLYSPRRNPEKAVERRNYVLKRMLEDGKISEGEYKAALQEQPRISNKANPYPKVAREILEPVRRYVEQKYGSDALYKEGLQVYTTATNPDRGHSVPAICVKRIVDRHGKVLEENDAPTLPTQGRE
jgi:penicillin-binding protein 1A